ncbi:2TM domain-containing protein [Leptothoe kymatousa]|uniref:2TM domain-containing protein n=1 Tax=Leptothoe kymatousa TAU-MAC 1615 TaxID=2364775 RepID=A0ABS5Y7E6_9CYAN|nr:2TM domain-containing protein [Leptothoe kymatousa]MBT9313766.1 2TM domain-containing protein [Leptothoe kymatousa TAU-MAC 1615]
MDKLYAMEDAQRILQIAIAQETESGELTQQQLLEIAEELNISPATLKSAEQEWHIMKGQAEDHRLFQSHRRQRLKGQFGRYAIVISFLVILDFVAPGGSILGHLGFSLYVALFWGLGLSLKAWRTLQTSGERYERDLDSWRRKRSVRQTINGVVNRFLGSA